MGANTSTMNTKDCTGPGPNQTGAGNDDSKYGSMKPTGKGVHQMNAMKRRTQKTS